MRSKLHATGQDAGVLDAAGIATARVLLVATAESFQTRNAVQKARAINPTIVIIVRTHTEADRTALGADGADHVVMGERELARSMLRQTLVCLHVPAEEAARLSAGLWCRPVLALPRFGLRGSQTCPSGSSRSS